MATRLVTAAVLLSVTGCLVVGAPPSGPRNRSHTAASIYDHPYVADLDGCTGVIVNPEWILTAAHCAYDKFTGKKKELKSVRVGSHYGDKGRRAYVETAVEHPKFDFFNSIQHDFLLLKLTRPLQFGPWVRAARLAGGYANDLHAGVEGEVYGFGHLEAEPQEDIHNSPKRLMRQDVRVMSTDDCRRQLEAVDLHGSAVCVTSDHHNPCDESGGPLVVAGAVVGVAAAVAERACAAADPLVFAPVPQVRNWIRYHTRSKPATTSTTAGWATSGYTWK